MSGSTASPSERPASGPGSTDNRNRAAQSGAAWGFVIGALVGAGIDAYLAGTDDGLEPTKAIGIIAGCGAIGAGFGTSIAIWVDDNQNANKGDDLPTPPISPSLGQDSSGGPGVGDRDGVSGDSSSGGEEAGGNGGGCFVAGTPVLLADGSQIAIEAVTVGDLLLAKDPHTSFMTSQPATTLLTHNVSSTLRLSLSDGSTLHTTAQHRFYVPGSGFVTAGSLSPGSAVVTHRNKSLTVVEITPIAGEAVVYNLEVANAHTYFVGAPGIWVHNEKPKDGTPGPPAGDSGG